LRVRGHDRVDDMLIDRLLQLERAAPVQELADAVDAKAIPAVCAAPPGLLSALDLPLVTGTGLMR
jgi:hypothetical protein